MAAQFLGSHFFMSRALQAGMDPFRRPQALCQRGGVLHLYGSALSKLLQRPSEWDCWELAQKTSARLH